MSRRPNFGTLRDWKLIYYHDPGRAVRYELFDLSKDLGEQNNLAADKPEIRTALARELAEYLKSVDATMPVVKATGKAVPLPE